MARGPEANQRMRDERREQILRSALKLFAAKGLAATKIADIAADSGSSQGLVYHYFRSKEELFTELIRGAFAQMNGAARGLEQLPLPPAEKIDRAIVELLRGMEQNEDAGRCFLLIAEASASEDVPAEAAAIIRQERHVPVDIITRILRAGQADGSIRDHDAAELSLVFWTLIKGLAIHRAGCGPEFKAPDPDLLISFFRTSRG